MSCYVERDNTVEFPSAVAWYDLPLPVMAECLWYLRWQQVPHDPDVAHLPVVERYADAGKIQYPPGRPMLYPSVRLPLSPARPCGGPSASPFQGCFPSLAVGEPGDAGRDGVGGLRLRRHGGRGEHHAKTGSTDPGKKPLVGKPPRSAKSNVRRCGTRVFIPCSYPHGPAPHKY